jgi:hypothetical protein
VVVMAIVRAAARREEPFFAGPDMVVKKNGVPDLADPGSGKSSHSLNLNDVGEADGSVCECEIGRLIRRRLVSSAARWLKCDMSCATAGV